MKSSKSNRWRQFLLRPIVGIPLAIVLLAVAAPFVFRASRLAGLPDIGEPFDLDRYSHIDINPDDNAFELYRPAAEKFEAASVGSGLRDRDFEVAINQGWNAAGDDVRRFLDDNREVLEQFRQGSERPDALNIQPGEDEPLSGVLVLSNLRRIVPLAFVEARRLEGAGQFQEAWKLYRAVVRGSRHACRHGAIYDRIVGTVFHHMAQEQIVRWAVYAQVDAAMLRIALSDVQKAHRMQCPPSDALRVQYLKSLNLLRGLETYDGHYEDPTWPDEWRVPGPIKRWLYGELEVTRRILKLDYANLLRYCDKPRWQRPALSRVFEPAPDTPLADGGITPAGLIQHVNRSLLARIFLPHIGELLAAHDRETARQALLELNLALQLHFREHGTFPESLDALIGPDFETLPLDPFDTGGPMHYRRETDGTAVVWSIGPDETDNGGRVEWRDRNGTGDILVRLVPPGERGASAP